MSPEQARGLPVDKRSDLFSLGCVLYAMCTGHSPFHGRTALEVANRVVNEDPPPLHVVSPETPQFLSNVVQRLLKKSPDERYQSARELSDLFNNHLSVLNQTPSDELAAALHAASTVPDAPAIRKTKLLRGTVIVLGIAALLVLGAWQSGIWPSKPVGSVPATDSTRPANPLKSTVTVAKSGEVDAQTIVGALEQVAPGGTIHVRDDAEYDEAIVLNDPARWEGITLETTANAVLRATEGQIILRIENTPNVTVRGFQMKLPNHQRGIDVKGSCPGLLLEDLRVTTEQQSPGNVPIGFAYLHAGAAGTQSEPMTVRRLSLTDRTVGIVIGEQSRTTAEPVRWLKIEDSRLIGAVSGGAFHCVLFGGIEQVTLQHNIFAQGECGLSIALGTEGGADWMRDLSIAQCTFFDLDSWFHWAGPVSQSERIQIKNNLIVRTKTFSFQDAQSAAFTQYWFSDNWGEATETSSAMPWVFSRIFAQIRLRSTDSASDDFLRPDAKEFLTDPKEPIPGFHSSDAP
jgi:hypothetical protein